MKKLVLVLLMVLVVTSVLFAQSAGRVTRTERRAHEAVVEPMVEEGTVVIEAQIPAESVEVRPEVIEQNVEQAAPPRAPSRPAREQNVPASNDASTQGVGSREQNRPLNFEQPATPNVIDRGTSVRPSNQQAVEAQPVMRNRDLERRAQGADQVFQAAETDNATAETRAPVRRRGETNQNVVNEPFVEPHIPVHSEHHGFNTHETIYNLIIRDEILDNDLFLARHYILSWERLSLTHEQRNEILTLQIQFFRHMAEQEIIMMNLIEEKRFLELIYNFIGLRRNAEEMLTVRRQKNGFSADFQEGVFDILTPDQREEYLRMRGLR